MTVAMFMRGINVGGIKVPMSELQECLSSINLARIKTFLQTGNVLFDSDENLEYLKVKIEYELSQRFNYKAHLLLFPAVQLQIIIDKSPYKASEKHSYVIFCDSQTTVDELVSQAADLDPNLEKVTPGDSVIYWSVDKGRTLSAGFSKIIAQSKYQPITTNRNINTLQKMVEYLQENTR